MDLFSPRFFPESPIKTQTNEDVLVSPKVSIILSVYNGARFLRPAIDSILAQTHDDFEFIAINDGSTDESAKILSEYDDQRIVHLNNRTNQGLAFSLNRAIAVARADYVARQDADDISHPERLCTLVSYLDRNPDVGVVGSAVQWIDKDSRGKKVWPSGLENREIQQLLLRTCPLIHGSTLFRKRCFDEVGGYDTNMPTGQDYDLWLRISEPWDLECLPDVLYQYRQHEDMASVRFGIEQSDYALAALKRAIDRRHRLRRKFWTGSNDLVVAKTWSKGQQWLAQRYIWWAQGVRAQSLRMWVSYLMSALMLDPTTPEIWRYLGRYFGRRSDIAMVSKG